MGGPLDGIVLENERGARKVTGRANYFGGVPAVVGHDLAAVEDILNCVLRVVFFDDGGGRDPLGQRECGHDVGFNELVVCGASGEDQVRSDAGFELANAFERAFPLLGRGRAIRVCWSSEHNDGVELGKDSVAGGNGPITDGGGDYADDKDREEDEEKLSQGPHPDSRLDFLDEAGCDFFVEVDGFEELFFGDALVRGVGYVDGAGAEE